MGRGRATPRLLPLERRSLVRTPLHNPVEDPPPSLFTFRSLMRVSHTHSVSFRILPVLFPPFPLPCCEFPAFCSVSGPSPLAMSAPWPTSAATPCVSMVASAVPLATTPP